MLDIIVPSYNERESIIEFLKVLKKSMKTTKFRLILVDDSKDDTAKIAKKVCNKLKIKNLIIKRENRGGKGSAVNTGLKELKAEYGVIIDADLEYHPKHIIPMKNKLKNYDLITSIRVREDPWYRKILGFGFRMLVTLLYNIPFETQSGLKVFRTKSVESIDLISKGWVFDVELIFKLMRKGMRVGTHNIKYTTRASGESKIGLLTPIQMFIDIIKLRSKLG